MTRMRSSVWALGCALALCSGAAGCKKREASKAEPVKTAKAPGAAGAPATQRRADAKTYGQKLSGRPALALTSVLAKPKSFDGKVVTFTGTVRAACRRKGCWMEVAPSASKAQQGCRVTFKDYGFFVPRDAAGSRARVEGVVRLKRLSKSEVDHLESEGLKFARKEPDGSAHELRVVATGVELWRL